MTRFPFIQTLIDIHLLIIGSNSPPPEKWDKGLVAFSHRKYPPITYASTFFLSQSSNILASQCGHIYLLQLSMNP